MDQISTWFLIELVIFKISTWFVIFIIEKENVREYKPLQQSYFARKVVYNPAYQKNILWKLFEKL